MRPDPTTTAWLTVLGSGTLLPDGERSSAAHHLTSGSVSLLLDCGWGTLHGLSRHGVEWAALTHVAVTHFHGDHVGDLVAVLAALKHGTGGRRSEPLTLVGPTGFGTFLRGVAGAFGSGVLEQGFPLEIVDLEAGSELRDVGGSFSLRCASTPHTDESVAYRVEGPWGSLGYTGDTARDDAVADFLDGCDVLIAECAHGETVEGERHLTPPELSAMARRARPGLLVVTHAYPPLTPAEAARRVRAGYGGAVLDAEDGVRIRLREGRHDVDPPRRPV